MQDAEPWYWSPYELEEPWGSNVEVSMIKGSGKAGEGVAGVGKARDSKGKADHGQGEASYGNGTDVMGNHTGTDGKGRLRRLHPARLLGEVMGSNEEHPTKSPSF